MFDFHAHKGERDECAFISLISEDEILSTDKDPNGLYSLGNLPWIKRNDISSIAGMAGKEPKLSIGEIGLDKRYGNREEQMEVFLSMLTIARELDRTVTVHSVGHNEEILKLLVENHIRRAIFHGYTSSWQSAREITKRGYYISLSKRSEKTRDYEKLLTLPFLLETDMKTGNEEKAEIKRLYEEVSLKTGIDQETRLEKIRKEEGWL